MGCAFSPDCRYWEIGPGEPGQAWEVCSRHAAVVRVPSSAYDAEYRARLQLAEMVGTQRGLLCAALNWLEGEPYKDYEAAQKLCASIREQLARELP